MQITLNSANIVILAENHNPAIVSVEWLKNKSIFDEEATNNFTNTPVFSFVEFPSFQLIVEPIRLQIALKTPSEENIPRLEKAGQNYIKALPETPYSAVGLNYTWMVAFDDQEVACQFLKNLLVADDKRLSDGLGTEYYEVGGILIVNEDVFRIRVIIERSAQSPTDISCHFNYHANVKDIQQVQQAIAAFQCKKEDSKQIVSRLF